VSRWALISALGQVAIGVLLALAFDLTLFQAAAVAYVMASVKEGMDRS